MNHIRVSTSKMEYQSDESQALSTPHWKRYGLYDTQSQKVWFCQLIFFAFLTSRMSVLSLWYTIWPNYKSSLYKYPKLSIIFLEMPKRLVKSENLICNFLMNCRKLYLNIIDINRNTFFYSMPTKCIENVGTLPMW